MKLNLVTNADDYKFIYKTRTDPKVADFLSGKPPGSYEDHLRHMSSNGHKFRILIHPTLGRLGYSQINRYSDKICEVGFCIPGEHQGKGFGSPLVKKTTEEALQYHRHIMLFVKDTNLRAIGLYEKIGYNIVRHRDHEFMMIFQ